MPRIAQWLPLTGSTLALLIVLGGAQAALFRLAGSPPKTEPDRQYLQCSTALALMHQDRAEEALNLLKRAAHSPMTLPQETGIGNELTPATQLLLLTKKLIDAAEQAKAQGKSEQASAYLEQCRVLERRIRSTPQPSGSAVKITESMQKAVRRAEVALLIH